MEGLNIKANIGKATTCILFMVAFIFTFFFELRAENVSVKAEETVEITDNQMEDILGKTLFGKYRFNMTGGTNLSYNNIHYWGWLGFNNPHYSESPGTLLHIDKMAAYEKSVNGIEGNSSGGYLAKDGDVTVYKAFLVIESSSDGSITELAEPDIYGNRQPKGYDNTKGMSAYPVTLVSPKGKVLEAAVQRYYYSDGEYRRTGLIDVTDFVAENGYGWYYCCNIPFDMNNQPVGCDAFCGWKLIVIESAEALPIRALSLKIGNKVVSGDGASASTTIDTGGLKTKLYGEVTGQLLYSFTGADAKPTGSENVMNYILDGEPETVVTSSCVRTERNPFVYLYSRNGIPIDSTMSDTGLYSVVSKDSWYCLSKKESEYGVHHTFCSSDIELIDVNSDNYDKHNVRFDNNVSRVGLDFFVYDHCTLGCNILGIAVDVEIGSYVLQQKSYPVISGDKSEIVVRGRAANNTLEGQIGLTGNIHLEFDKGLKIKEVKIISGDVGRIVRISDSIVDLEKTELKKCLDYVEYEVVLEVLEGKVKYKNTSRLDGDIYNSGSVCANICGLKECESDTFGNGMDILYYAIYNSEADENKKDYIDIARSPHIAKETSESRTGYFWNGYKPVLKISDYEKSTFFGGDTISLSDYGYTGICNKNGKYLGVADNFKASANTKASGTGPGQIFCVYRMDGDDNNLLSFECSEGILTNEINTDSKGVYFRERTDEEKQLWMLEPAQDGYVYIKSSLGGYLDGDDELTISSFTGLDSQKWQLVNITEVFESIWSPCMYTITLDYNRPDFTEKPLKNSGLREIGIYYDDVISMLPYPDIAGYVFSGWNTERSGGGDYIDNGMIYNYASDITLYAQWKKKRSILLKVSSDSYAASIIRDGAENYNKEWFDMWGKKSIQDMKNTDAKQYIQVWDVNRENVRQLTQHN